LSLPNIKRGEVRRAPRDALLLAGGADNLLLIPFVLPFGTSDHSRTWIADRSQRHAAADWGAPQLTPQNDQLMSERRALCFTPALRLEWQCQERKE